MRMNTCIGATVEYDIRSSDTEAMYIYISPRASLAKYFAILHHVAISLSLSLSQSSRLSLLISACMLLFYIQYIIEILLT